MRINYFAKLVKYMNYILESDRNQVSIECIGYAAVYGSWRI